MLEQARDFSAEDVASEIRRIGFACTMCGGCCRHSEGDNRVLLTTVDIDDLKGNSHYAMDRVATPMLPEGINIFSQSS